MKNPLLTGLYAGMAGAVLFFASPISFAAENPTTIVITASRSAETVDETLVPVTVITREEIEKKQAIGMSEVLKGVPGVSFSNNGGLGKNTSVFLRGTNSDQVLVLVDGVKVGSATLGTTPFHDLPLDQIEKIEVVRGPRSSLYGSEAIGGVIQIFTKKGTGKLRPEFSIAAGSNSLGKLDAGISGGTEDAWYRVGVSTLTTDGINDCRGSATAGCFTDEPDKDGYDNDSISVRGGVAVSDRFQLEGNILSSNNATEFDGSFQNESETSTNLVSVKSLFDVTEQWKATLLLANTEDKSDNFLNSTPVSKFDTERTQVSFQNDFLVSEKSLVIAGIDYVDDEVSGSEAFAVTSRDNTGVFVSLRTNLNDNDVELSIRNDDNQQFGDEATGGAGWGRELANGGRVTASYGTAFKAPSFNELYFPGFGNASLEPETSESLDIGYADSGEYGKWSVNLYQTKIDNLIGFDAATFLPANIDKAKITGLEFSGQTKIGNWGVGANLTLQDPQHDSGGPNQGNTEQILQVDIFRDFGRYSLGGSVFSQGHSYDDLANMTRLDGFTLVDLNGSFRINQSWSAGLSVKNLLDEEYETAAYFNQDGTNFLATLRYQPGNR
jgi:vitamin B12 transporter